GRKIDHAEARAVRRRRGAEDASAHILDLLADADIDRHAVAAPDESRFAAAGPPRRLGVGREIVDQHLGDAVGVMAGDDAADRRNGIGHFFLSFYLFIAFPAKAGIQGSISSLSLVPAFAGKAVV